MSVDAAEVRALLRALHSGPAQEAAATRLAIALWRRALARGDARGAEVAASEVEARLEALFDGLAALEQRGKVLLESSGFSTEDRRGV